VRRCSLLPAWLLSLAAWGAPPGLPDEAALRAEMARQQARGELLMRRAEESFQANPGRPTQSIAPRCQWHEPAGRRSPGGGGTLPPDAGYTGPIRGRAGPAGLRLLRHARAQPGAAGGGRGQGGGSAGVPGTQGRVDQEDPGRLRAPGDRLGARATLDPEAFARHRIEAVPAYLLGGCGRMPGTQTTPPARTSCASAATPAWMTSWNAWPGRTIPWRRWRRHAWPG
jgi:hypothetical protein